MKCVTCGKEIEKNDFFIVKSVGITCYDCFSKISNNSHSYDSETKVSTVLYVTSAIIFLIGLILGIILGNQYQVIQVNPADVTGLSSTGQFNVALMFCIWIVSFISGMFFIALGKIVSLLQKIKNNE
jgi:hypothetical protein